MKRIYEELVMNICYLTKADVLTLSGEEDTIDGLITDRTWSFIEGGIEP